MNTMSDDSKNIFSNYGIYDLGDDLELSLPNVSIKFQRISGNAFSYFRENSEGKIWIKGEMYKLDISSDLSIINNGRTLWYVMKDVLEVQIMDNDPEDEMNPSKIYTERCKILFSSPPKNWDGVWKLESK